MDKVRLPGSRRSDLDPAKGFKFTALKGELCVCGVYLRIFNMTGLTVDIDDPSVFAVALLDYIEMCINRWGGGGLEGDEGGDTEIDEVYTRMYVSVCRALYMYIYIDV
jgi:hypothetical protein